MKNNKIVIIVPVYKVEKYLHRCIDSILNQTYKDFELILVDDGSPDNSPAICDEYAAHYDFIHVIHKENGGQGAARNIGIEYALSNLQFKWFCFIDSDDYIHEKFLEFLIYAAYKTCTDVCCCGYTRKDAFEVVSFDKIDDLIIKGSADNLCEAEHDVFNYGVPWGRLYKRYLFEYLRFPTDRFYEDGFTIYKALFSVAEIAVVKMKLYCWFLNPNSTTQSKPTAKKVNDFIDAMLENIEFYHKNHYQKAYMHEINCFFYRMSGHLRLYKKDRTLKSANKRFRFFGKKIIQNNKSLLPYDRYDDVYKTVFNPLCCFLMKLFYRFKKNNG